MSHFTEAQENELARGREAVELGHGDDPSRPELLELLIDAHNALFCYGVAGVTDPTVHRLDQTIRRMRA